MAFIIKDSGTSAKQEEGNSRMLPRAKHHACGPTTTVSSFFLPERFNTFISSEVQRCLRKIGELSFIFQNIQIAEISFMNMTGYQPGFWQRQMFLFIIKYCLSRLGIASFKVLLTHKGFIQIQTLLSAQIYLHLGKTIEKRSLYKNYGKLVGLELQVVFGKVCLAGLGEAS